MTHYTPAARAAAAALLHTLTDAELTDALSKQGAGDEGRELILAEMGQRCADQYALQLEAAPSAEQVRTYLLAYYADSFPSRRFLIGAVEASREGAHCVDCTVFLAGEAHHWTLWMEGGRCYGEW